MLELKRLPLAFDSERGSVPRTPHSADTITPPIHTADDPPRHSTCTAGAAGTHSSPCTRPVEHTCTTHTRSGNILLRTPSRIGHARGLHATISIVGASPIHEPTCGSQPQWGSDTACRSVWPYWCIAAMDWQAEDCKPFSTAIRRTVSEQTASRRTASAEDLRACDRNVRQGLRADGM